MATDDYLSSCLNNLRSDHCQANGRRSLGGNSLLFVMVLQVLYENPFLFCPATSGVHTVSAASLRRTELTAEGWWVPKPSLDSQVWHVINML